MLLMSGLILEQPHGIVCIILKQINTLSYFHAMVYDI